MFNKEDELKSDEHGNEWFRVAERRRDRDISACDSDRRKG